MSFAKPMNSKCHAIAFLILGLLVSGLVWAGLEEGVAAYRKMDYQAAFREWKPVAESGNPTAQANLANLYEHGFGIQKDLASAALWYRKAAENGHGLAQNN